MAPEQVRGERGVGAAADVFAVGCLLYECLTGRPPFFGEQVVSVLAKILFEEPPDIRLIRPGLPAQVVELLASMLVKDAAARLPDGLALAAALARLPGFEDDDLSQVATHAPPAPLPAPEVERPSGLRGEVQELLGVVLASAAGAMSQHAETVQAATPEALADGQGDLLLRLRALGAQAEFLLDGSLVAVLQPSGSAVDQATQAAQAALLVHEGWPAAQVAVTMGLGTRPAQMPTSVPTPLPVGEVLDRAARLLVADTLAGGESDSPGARGSIVLDAVTAGLISGRFQVAKRSAGSFLLLGPGAALDDQRPLLGKPTPCVGREQELGQLLSALSTTIDEPLAQAVIVRAPAGSGKSRLRHEFLRRIEARGQDVLVLIGRGASLSMGSAFAMLGQALRGLCGVHEGDSADERWRRFAGRIGESLPPERAAAVIPLLAAISQVTPGAGVPAPLRAGLQDPSLFYEEFARAFVEFLAAECAARPVLLILEDLHWGDASTVRLVDTALRELADRPLLVVALGRPEMREQFPDLWSKRSCQHIPLWGLGKRACERLIRQVLGPDLSPEVESRIIAQSGGNALYLEERVRLVGGSTR